MEDKPRLPEECSVAMNKVLSYELHISDAYLSMAYNSIDESVQPCFATFFEDQADMKRENGKEFLEYLGKYRNKICLPVFKPLHIILSKLAATEWLLSFSHEPHLPWSLDQQHLHHLGSNQKCKFVDKLNQRPEVENWGTGVRALECALELEDQLTTLLLDLKTTASAKKERGVLEFMGKYLKEQKRSTKNLQTMLKHYKDQAQKEEKAC